MNMDDVPAAGAGVLDVFAGAHAERNQAERPNAAERRQRKCKAAFLCLCLSWVWDRVREHEVSYRKTKSVPNTVQVRSPFTGRVIVTICCWQKPHLVDAGMDFIGDWTTAIIHTYPNIFYLTMQHASFNKDPPFPFLVDVHAFMLLFCSYCNRKSPRFEEFWKSHQQDREPGSLLQLAERGL